MLENDFPLQTHDFLWRFNLLERHGIYSFSLT